MNEYKKIEEMAKDICRSRFAPDSLFCKECETECLYYQISTALIDKGYRKASDVAREIFAEVERAFGGAHMLWYHTRPGEYEEYEKIKKKYTEGK